MLSKKKSLGSQRTMPAIVCYLASLVLKTRLVTATWLVHANIKKFIVATYFL